jgi:ATP-dependent RNA helicase HelY
MARLRPGQVINAAKGRYHGPVAVVASAHRKGGMRLTTVTTRGDLLLLTAHDFDDVPRARGSVRLPTTFEPNRTDYRRAVARELGRAKLSGDARRRGAVAVEPDPLERDPELRHRLRAARQAARFERELVELGQRVEQHNQSLAREFDRVLDVLSRRGYVERDRADWRLTWSGRMLSRIFHESDLLVAEVIRNGLLDGLAPADLAGLLSTFVYEHRSPEPPPPPWFPSTDVAARWRRIAAISEDLAADERSVGLGEHRPPDPGFVAAAHAWVAGEDFAGVVEQEELSGGDFVRTMKQLIDLARQLSQVAADPGVRRVAAELVERARRGVVADVTAVAAATVDA